MHLSDSEPNGDEDNFRSEYPDLLSTLAKLDLPIQKRLLLPEDAYRMGSDIGRNVESFKYEVLNFWERVNFPGHKPSLNETDARQRCAERTLAMRKQVEDLQRSLEKAYQSTFE